MKTLLALATAVTAIALAVPAAFAAPQQQGYAFITDTLGGDGHASQGYSFITDTLGGDGHPRQGAPQGYAFVSDTLAPGGGPARPVVTVSTPSTFSWVDAGVGAGAAGGLLLALLGASLLVVRRQGRPAI
jgi:hypothetical protein